MNPAMLTTRLAMESLRQESPGAFLEAIDHAHHRDQPLLSEAAPTLERWGIVQQGVMHDVVAEAIRHFYPEPTP